MFCHIYSLCFLGSTYKWSNTVFVFVWLISLNIVSSRSIHVVAMAGFHSFQWWVTFHCVYVPHLLDPVIWWWKLRLLQHLGYCKYCCSEHRCAAPFFETWETCFCWLPKGVLDVTAQIGRFAFSSLWTIQRSYLWPLASRIQFCVLFQLYRCQYLPLFSECNRSQHSVETNLLTTQKFWVVTWIFYLKSKVFLMGHMIAYVLFLISL